MKHAGITSTHVLTPVESKQMIDTFLAPLLQQLTEDARRISPHYETLWQDIQVLYHAGGKRLRSYMTLLTYEAFSTASPDTIMPAAAAQELLHSAMLIHDDIIDRDDIRYGVKNVASQYMDHYEELIEDTVDRQHYANSAAMLAGDLLISQAYILIAETKVEPSLVLASQRLLAQAMFRVIGGELLDTEAVFRGADSANPLLIAEEKTASYSFVTPFLIGATLSQASPIQRNILEKLGEQLGIAYQLRDDILGVFGNEDVTGKSTDGDLKEGKQTFLLEEFQKLAIDTQHDEFHTLFGRHDVTDADIVRMKALLIESGAKDAVEALILAYQEHAHILVESLDIDEHHHVAFRQLIDLCVKREK
jgi:geranylgeranyl pyrophosphate synthase